MVDIPLSAPNFSPAIGNGSFVDVWAAFFDSLTDDVNASAPLADPTFTGTVTVPILSVTGTSTFAGAATFSGTAAFTSTAAFQGVGFFGTAPLTAKPNVLGGWGSNATGKRLAAALASLGLITDSTTTTGT